jgi:hypothetical protein
MSDLAIRLQKSGKSYVPTDDIRVFYSNPGRARTFF